MNHALTIWTIRLAVICLYSVLILRQVLPDEPFKTGKRLVVQVAKAIWLTGAILSVVHTLCAFGFFHHWSHVAALEDTARQTDELLGFRFGGGLYFNYVFVALWAVDSVWWIANSESYESRSRWIGFGMVGYLLFIAINGTAVFESGISRWGGVVLLLTLVTCTLRKTFGSKNNIPSGGT